MDHFDAVMIAEGAFEPESEEEYLEAWQTLVNDGSVWKLQGFFGRTATNLIETGLITRPEPQPEKQELARIYMVTMFCVHPDRGYSVAMAVCPSQSRALALAKRLHSGKKPSLAVDNARAISREVYFKIEPWVKEPGTGICVQEGRPIMYWEVGRSGVKEYTLGTLGYTFRLK
jgi:hypothetical protein